MGKPEGNNYLIGSVKIITLIPDVFEQQQERLLLVTAGSTTVTFQK